LFYVRIPYRDQSQLPNFDSAITDLNFAQIFSENQFSGGDRINDANELTVALTSRIFDSLDGAERLRLSLAQRFYLTRPKVYLVQPGDSGGDFNASDLIASAGGHPAKDWWLDSAWQFNTREKRSQKLGLNLRYQPQAGQTLNLRYRLDRLTDIKQIDISGQWPLGGGWNVLARENWSIRDRRSLEALLGLEYNAGCWALRLVAQRFVTSTQQNSSTFFLQLELNDLGRLGSNPLETLRQSIPGYAKLN
jgi:LPS-assembly protein